MALSEEQQRSSGGAPRILGPSPRVLTPFNVGQSTPVDVDPGYNTISVCVPVSIVAPAVVEFPIVPPAGFPPVSVWPLLRNWRMKFSGSLAFTPVNPADISLESCGFVLDLLDGTGKQLASMQNAARIASLTALAAAAPISFDEWLIDHNDLMALAPDAVGFYLFMALAVNNAGGKQDFTLSGFAKVAAVQFSTYVYDKWE